MIKNYLLFASSLFWPGASASWAPLSRPSGLEKSSDLTASHFAKRNHHAFLLFSRLKRAALPLMDRPDGHPQQFGEFFLGDAQAFSKRSNQAG